MGIAWKNYSESDAVTKVYRAHTQELWQTPELIITILSLPGTISKPTREQFIERFLYEAKRIVRLRHKLLFPLLDTVNRMAIHIY